jgi:hypothetical protein
MVPTINVNGETRIVAPSTLTPRERKVFNEIVNACTADHFRNSDIPLLTSFCTATVVSRSMANKPKQFSTFEKATRLQAALATKLRLNPQTRLDPKSVHRQTVGSGLVHSPWDNPERFKFVGSDDDDSDAA